MPKNSQMKKEYLYLYGIVGKTGMRELRVRLKCMMLTLMAKMVKKSSEEVVRSHIYRFFQ
jgi:hypothetical protein